MSLFEGIVTDNSALNDYNEELSAFESVAPDAADIYDQRQNAYQGVGLDWDYQIVDNQYQIVLNKQLENGGLK